MEPDIKNIWQKKRVIILFFVTLPVLVLLFFTAIKLISYSFRHPVIADKAEKKAFDMVMTYREGIREDKRDHYLKKVNKFPHIFLRASGTLEEKSLGRKGERK